MPLNAPSVRLAAQRGHCFMYLYILGWKQKVRVARYGIRGRELGVFQIHSIIRAQGRRRRISALRFAATNGMSSRSAHFFTAKNEWHESETNKNRQIFRCV